MGKNKFQVPLLAPWFSKRGPIKGPQTKGDLEWKSSSLPLRTLSHDRAGMLSLWSHRGAVCRILLVQRERETQSFVLL